ncbi:Uncharacterized protein GBIM_00853 [Gryllus bimaculatus]|nr:Uncharacterized protein GBIM_00853 [Gryllus bimaculatus]
MPPFIQVQTLYDLCLKRVFHILCQSVERSDCVEMLRAVIQSSLHAGIREHLVQLATLHLGSDVYSLLDLLSILMDKEIKKLDHSMVETLRMDQCAGLYSSLEHCSATGLHELTVKVALDPRKVNHLEAVSAANVTFHRVLLNGLASSLQKLVLRSVCDNEILRLLGQHSNHLKYLDVRSSWLVDDGGLKQLCFKDSIWAEYFDVYSDGSIDMSALNNCCHTLQEVRIQDTNTSEIGVALLLLLIPKLKSLGGFIYYRNVGDAILNMRAAHPRLQLNLTQLWDTSLPPEKAEQMAPCTPHLSSLYTRGSWLGSLVHFPEISSITIDFDFADFNPLLEHYLTLRGPLLRELVIVDQNHAVDLTMLIELCPSLEQLGAKLCQSYSDINVQSFLPHLTVARIRVGATLPLITLLGQVHSLQHLEVMLEEECFGDGVEMFDDLAISEALVIPGPRALSIFLMLSECNFTADAAHALMLACPALQRLGDLQFWNGVNEHDVEELALEVRHCNYSFSFRYHGKWYPPEHHFSLTQALQ